MQQHAKKPTLFQEPILWLVISAALILTSGVALPSIIVGRSRNLPVDQSLQVVSQAPEGLVLMAPEGKIEKANVRVERTTTTSRTEDNAVAIIDSLIDVYANGTRIGQVNDSIEVNRESVYPVPDGANLQTLIVGPFGAGITKKNASRTGLNFFFPSATEQRSYPFYDLATDASRPIDYDRKEKIGKNQMYVFKQSILSEPVTLSLDKSNQVKAFSSQDVVEKSGAAHNLYTDAELAALNIDRNATVETNLFYHVDREVTVEPVTGTIINVAEDITMFFATSRKEAEQTLALHLNPARRTVFSAPLRWTEQSRTKALEHALPVIRTHRLLAALAWTSKLASALLLLAAGALYLRRKQNV